MANVPRDTRLYVGTDDGVRTLAPADEDRTSRAEPWRVTEAALAGESVRALAVHPADPDALYAGCAVRGAGLHRSTDGGATVERAGLDDRWVFEVRFDPTDGERLYVGTEPPDLFRSEDGGETFAALAGLDDVEGRDDWTSTHDPHRAGHVHGLALHPERPERVVAGVEMGGIVATDDDGETWTAALPGYDVHEVTPVPADPDRLFAAAGEGLFRSANGGGSWRRVPGFSALYVAAVRAVGPEWLYALAAPTPAGRTVRLYVTHDGGGRWERVSGTLGPASGAGALAVHPIDPEILFHAGETPEMGDDTDAGGDRVRVSSDGGRTWTTLASGLSRVRTLAVSRAQPR